MTIKWIDPYRIGLTVLLIAFVTFKWNCLHLPLYWDEAWVYGPAVKAMSVNGLSLLPNTIGTQLSRGHPLLFHFIAALWSKIFGISNTSLHAFALLTAVALLLLTYRVGELLGSRQIGIAAVLLVGLNEIFLAQSAILLPEMLLGLFFLLAVWMFMSRNWFTYILAASCALLIKESALVLILALLCWHVVRTIADRGAVGWKDWSGKAAIMLAPLIPFSLFLFYQYLTYGWVFFPEHLRLISFDIRDVHYLFKFGYRELFEQQGMEWATLAFGLIAPLAWKGWTKRYMSLVTVLIYVTAIKVLDGKWSLPPLSTLVVALSCFGLILLYQFLPLRKKEPHTGEFVGISMILILGFILFSSFNFFSDRYLLGMIPFVALGMSAVLYSSLAPWHKLLFPAVMAAIASILLLHIGKDGHVGDTRLSYVDDIHVHKDLIRDCEELGLQNSCMYGSFMEKEYMTDRDAGYLDDPSRFQCITDTIDSQVAYALVTQASPKDLQDQLSRMGFVRIRSVHYGQAWGEIYRKGNTQ